MKIRIRNAIIAHARADSGCGGVFSNHQPHRLKRKPGYATPGLVRELLRFLDHEGKEAE